MTLGFSLKLMPFGSVSFLFFFFPGKAHPEVGLDHMGAAHFQLPSGFAIPRHFVALIIHNAHICEQVWPALAHPVLHFFFFVQLALAALQSHTDRLGACTPSLPVSW